MRTIKLWSIILPIFLAILRQNNSEDVNDVDYSDGFVGCLFHNVCLNEEECYDDGIFGKCIKRRDESNELSPPESEPDSNSNNQEIDTDRSESKYKSTYCLLKALYYRFILNDTAIDPLQICASVLNSESDYPFSIEEYVLPYEMENDYDKDNNYDIEDTVIRPTYKRSAATYEELNNYIYAHPNSYDSLSSDDNQVYFDPVDHKYQRLSEELQDFNRQLKTLINLSKKYSRTRKENGADIESKISDPDRIYLSDRGNNNQDTYLRFKTFRPTNRFQYYPMQDTGQLLDSVKQLHTGDVETHPKQLERSWVWIKFSGDNLNNQKARTILATLSNDFKLQPPITDYFLDITGHILYFQVPPNTDFTADDIVNDSRKEIGGYKVQAIGFGRGAPVISHSDFRLSREKYTITLVICFSVLGVGIILFCIYLLQVCHTKLKQQNQHQQSERDGQLLQAEQGQTGYKCQNNKTNQKYNSNNNNHYYYINNNNNNNNSAVKASIKTRLFNFLHRKFCPPDPQPNQTVNQIIRRSIRPSVDAKCDSVFEPNYIQRWNRKKSSVESMSKKLTRQNSAESVLEKMTSASQRSDISSGSSEPPQSMIDVPTGHLILAYMEEHLKDTNKMTSDWALISNYKAEEAVPCEVAKDSINKVKNRSCAPITYEQSRVKLRSGNNDYINASLLYDNSPRNPVYIATITPTYASATDFWLMIWEQNSVVIVCLERTDELQTVDQLKRHESSDASVQYWPNEGYNLFGKFEVHLVSEHSCCENYRVRSIYLKNVETNETRTVTQFHYLNWSDKSVKLNTILEFRRKVNRSFRGMMSPIVVHCIDGCGRTGTYILIDLILNRIAKGICELDILASIEHLRDQRPNMIQNIHQYELALSAIAHEVDSMLKINT